MEITVNYIAPHDHSKHGKMEARVDFNHQSDDGFGYSASVIVWIPKRDAPLSELKTNAVEAAFDFLKSVLAARP